MEPAATNNGRGSDAWLRSWTQLSIDRRSFRYCLVTFDHPPINAISAATVAEISELVDLIEQDPDLNVVVFASANRDFYLADHDVQNAAGRTWVDVLDRLARAPAVTIASIRGRARGAGSEFVLACDLRFASRENTLLGWFDADIGVVRGGGTAVRLVRLLGRGRALEILLAAGDLDGPRSEQYGCVNRLIADDRLDDEVEAIACRLAGFDHEALSRTKLRVGSIPGA